MIAIINCHKNVLLIVFIINFHKSSLLIDSVRLVENNLHLLLIPVDAVKHLFIIIIMIMMIRI